MIAPLGENVLLLKMLLASNGIVVLEKQQHICDILVLPREYRGEFHPLFRDPLFERKRAVAEMLLTQMEFGMELLC